MFKKALNSLQTFLIPLHVFLSSLYLESIMHDMTQPTDQPRAQSSSSSHSFCILDRTKERNRRENERGRFCLVWSGIIGEPLILMLNRF